jgi:ABC-type branched-subunit amino acid transport system substrate-binding protein
VEAIFHYAEDGIDTAANKQFQAAIAGKAPEKVSPNFVQANAFATGSALLAALKQSPGARKADLAAALAKVRFEAPWGPLSFDPKTHYPVIGGYYYKVVKGPQRLEDKVLGTIEGQPVEPGTGG